MWDQIWKRRKLVTGSVDPNTETGQSLVKTCNSDPKHEDCDATATQGLQWFEHVATERKSWHEDELQSTKRQRRKLGKICIEWGKQRHGSVGTGVVAVEEELKDVKGVHMYQMLLQPNNLTELTFGSLLPCTLPSCQLAHNRQSEPDAMLFPFSSARRRQNRSVPGAPVLGSVLFSQPPTAPPHLVGHDYVISLYVLFFAFAFVFS